jgi:hypothetical protein
MGDRIRIGWHHDFLFHRLISIRLCFVFLMFGFFPMGCGYQFRATGEPLGIKIQSLAIPLIESTSSELGFEAIFTRVFRETFISKTKIPLLPESRAEAVLTGRIYDISTEPIAFTQTQQTVGGEVTTYSVTSRRQVTVKLDAKFTITATGEVIFHAKAMEERANYNVSTDSLVTRYNEQVAYELIARALADRLFLKSTERF